jgi:hypothetical protein
MTSLVKFGDGARRFIAWVITAFTLRALALALLTAVFSAPCSLAQTPGGSEAEASRRQAKPAVSAADSGVIAPGDLVVTGFSGVKQKQDAQPAGGAPLDAFFIDLDGSSAQAFHLDPNAPPHGQVINAPVLLQVKARDVGQVFGVALDDAPAPNIYLAATSAYGLQIVVDEGITRKRVTRGQAGARFMPGQFGENGGPGGVWKVDGATGAVSVFATIPGNRGPGLGDIAYDSSSGLFFVSDFDTGLIHRIDANGHVLDSFDHGLNGRPAAGMPAIADDNAVMNVAYPAFDSENPDTWGLTQPERRVWGLAAHGGRLYYAVWSGPQIWSVGVSRNGFANDARLEFQVVGSQPAPVAHMAFDGSGVLYLAQRGGLLSSYDYAAFARARISKALRYRQTGGGWSREDYSVGFSPPSQNASGGVALGYGYDSKGKPDRNHCDATLWTTGDALRNDPARSAELAPGGPSFVHGLQGNDVSWARTADAPARSYFVDYDGVYNDPRAEGHVGSAAIYQTCAARNDGTPQLHALEEPPEQEQPACAGCGEPPCDPNDPYCSRKPCAAGDPYCHQRNLKISMRPLSACHKPRNTFVCGYRITVTNTGPDDYDGLIRIRDVVPPGARLIVSGAPQAPCNLINGLCATPSPVHLVPNDSISFVVRLKTTPAAARRLRCHVHNKARIVYAPSGSNANTNPDDDEAATAGIIPSSQCEKEKNNLRIEKRTKQCVRTGGGFTCVYDLRFVNTGPGDYRGVIAFSNTVPNGSSASVVSSTFKCTDGPAHVCKSNESVSLSPGGSVDALVKVVTPAAMARSLRCRVPVVAHIDAPASGSEQNTDPSDDSSMAVAAIPAADCSSERSNLKIEKRAKPCVKSGTGYNCIFDVRYANTGPGVYQGVVSFSDTLPAGASATFLSADFTCVGGPLYTCTSNQAVTLPVGASGDLLVKVSIPLKAAKSLDCQIRSEAKIVLAPGGSDLNWETADDAASATALAPPPGCTPQSPPGRKSCAPGLEFNPETGRCESALGPACPVGAEWNPKTRICEAVNGGESATEARNDNCPEGSTGTWPHCRTAAQSCPPGWKWDSQRCAAAAPENPDTDTKCPSGFEKVGGQCVRSQPTGSVAGGGGAKPEMASTGAAPRNGAAAQDGQSQNKKPAPAHKRAQRPKTRQASKEAPASRRAYRRALRQKGRQHDIHKRRRPAPPRKKPRPWPGGILPPWP